MSALTVAAPSALAIIEPMRASRRLVGRTHELDRVVDALGLAAGSGGVVVLSGDAGIGKTRLLREVVAQAEGSGQLVVIGHCVAEAGIDLPYLPFAELLGTLRDSAPDEINAVADTHPALAQLLAGTPLEGHLRASNGPGLLAEAVHAALTMVAASRPVLVVIEDAHWADHSSRDLLTLLMTRGFAGQVGLVVSYRSDDLHRRHPLHATLGVWARLPEVTRVHLEPLPGDHMRTLIEQISDARGDEVSGIIERAAGNAFFAEELVASGNVLGADLGRVLRTRFEQLDPSTQRVVQAAAVMGRALPHDLLQAVVELPPEELDTALSVAIDHHTLEPLPGDSYGFWHALVAEAIRDDLLPGQRRRLHAAFAAALSARPELGTASDLARHAAASGDLDSAVTAGIAAGESALALGGPREASTLFEQVLTWMHDADPRRDDTTTQAAMAAAANGDVHRGVQLIRDRLAHSNDSSPARARLLAGYVTLARVYDDSPDRLDRARQAMALTEGMADRTRLQAQVAEVQALADLGRYTEAAVASEAALALADELDAADLATDLRTILVAWESDEADLPEVETRLLELVRDRPLDHPTHVRAHYRLGLVAYSRGDLRDALAHFEAGTAIGDRMGRPWGVFESSSRANAALVEFHLGNLDGALDRLNIPGPPFPQPGYAGFQSSRHAILTARDWEVDPSLFESVLPYWPDDALMALTAMAAQVELLGRQGQLDGVAALVDRAMKVMERQWGAGEEIQIRIAAILTAVLADSDRAERSAQSMLQTTRGRIAEQAHAVIDANTRLGTESRAWAARLAAEELFLQWADGSPVDPEALVSSWRQTVARFEEWHSPYEVARSRVRLAAVLAATGEIAAAREQADLVRAAAESLPSEPLLRLLQAVPGLAAVQRGNQQELTPREHEILEQLALGRSNGQIGKQLFISTKTASVHVSNILAKLGAGNRGAAVAIARDRGLLPG